jgi:hypothetical protein
MIEVTVSDHTLMSGVHPVICHIDPAIISNPISIISRGSTRLLSRPATSIAIMVPTPRGTISKPASDTE